MEFKAVIEKGYNQIATLSPANVSLQLQQAVAQALDGLNEGRFRVAEKINGQWQVHEWLKKAVLLSFRLQQNQPISGGFTQYYDKIPVKFAHMHPAEFSSLGIRIVPPAVARFGAYIGPNTVLMPSYINIGAYVGEGSMVDTWVTVGSCAQIGKHVHLSGGVGIGGVLEPLQAKPTIIEDHCFIGARSEIVEGVVIGEGSVLSMGVYISQSTRILHRDTGDVTYGYVPPGSVVVPGNLPSKDGSHSLYCVVIVKTVDAKTREKVGINELLRGVE